MRLPRCSLDNQLASATKEQPCLIPAVLPTQSSRPANSPATYDTSSRVLLSAEAALHDLNNLLTGIAVTAALIGEELPTGHALHDDLAAIQLATLRGGRLVRQLRRQPVQAIAGSIDLVALLYDVAPLIKALLGSQIVYHASLSVALGLIHGDRAQLERVILNLVCNARDAMRDGGALLIELSAAGDSSCAGVRLTVRDTGVGMNSATLARALEPGFTTRAHGSGLGLAICAEIVRQHSGSIRLASAPGQGTTITVELPSAPDAADIAIQHVIV